MNLIELTTLTSYVLCVLLLVSSVWVGIRLFRNKTVEDDWCDTFPFSLKIQSAGLVLTHGNGSVTIVSPTRVHDIDAIKIKAADKVLIRPYIKGQEDLVGNFKQVRWIINTNRRSYLNIAISEDKSSLYIQSVLKKGEKLPRNPREVVVFFEAVDTQNDTAYWADFSLTHIANPTPNNINR